MAASIFQYLPELPSKCSLNRRCDCLIFTSGKMIIENQELWCYIISSGKGRNLGVSKSNSISFQLSGVIESDFEVSSDDLSTSTLENNML